MRGIALLVLLCSFSDVANAQTAEQCPPTARAGDFLNCYNGTAPPPNLGKSKRSNAPTATDNPAAIKGPIADDKPASKAAADGREPHVDMLAVENKKLDAKLKTLCRGC
jgi:hypothetical protein